jgi:hypothetical protein
MKNDIYREVFLKSPDYAKVLEAKFERAFEPRRDCRRLLLLRATVFLRR